MDETPISPIEHRPERLSPDHVQALMARIVVNRPPGVIGTILAAAMVAGLAYVSDLERRNRKP